MIIFESIRWKNFLSTGDRWTEVKLDSSMSTLIIGHNGSGKSTILDALCFGLFNKPFRKITKSQLVNSINEKGTKVEVNWTIGKDEYRVFRAIKPNIFELYKNNKLIDQDAATRDTQKYLEQSILKLNYKSFTQVVILGSSTFVPFMQLQAGHRREVIEDLLDIKIFSSMNMLLKERVKKSLELAKDCEHLMAMNDHKVSAQQKLLDTMRLANDDRQKEKSVQLDLNQEKILDLEQEVKLKIAEVGKSEAKLKRMGNVKDELFELRDKQTLYKRMLSDVKKDFKFFTENKTCPTCTQEIEDEFRQRKCDTLSEKQGEYDKQTKDVTKKINTITKKIEKYDALSTSLYELRTTVNSLEKDVVRIQKDSLRIEQEIIELKSNTPNIKAEGEILDVLMEEAEKTRVDCAQVREKLDEFAICHQLLKDGGVKKQIIKKYIPIFNSLINKYLQSMDFYVNFTLDEEFNEVIKSRFRDEFSYSSFSEGEKQKIDLALLFTWREVARMKNSVATNLLLLDEVFDSSLDTEGTNELLKILRSLGKGTNVFVISHKGDILVDKFMNTLKFEKQNDFSKLVDVS